MATFAEDQITRLETAIAANTTVVSTSVDGVSVTFSSMKEILAAYDYWKSRYAREQGTRPRVAQINLGNP